MKNYRIEAFFIAAASTVFAVMFFLHPSVMIDGLRRGLTVCGSSVIPSLFPFMVLSDFLVRSGFCSIIGNRASPLTQKLFSLPGTAGCAVIMSLIGGFPVGAKMTAQLFENGDITAKQGRRMMTFCINAGPAFVIGTVGTVMLSSRKAGIILFSSMTVTSLLTGIASKIISRGEAENRSRPEAVLVRGALTDSVSQSVQSMLNVCAWIILFSGINEFFIRLPVSRTAAVWFSIVSEVTGGCMSASGCFPTCVLALVLGWSGLAVHCQLMPYLKILGMKITYLWATRLIAGGVSAVIAWVLFRIFPCEISVFSNASDIISKPYSVSAPAAAAMLVLSALMLTDIKLARKKNL